MDKVGRPLWHFQPRAAVNLRQLRETDTIEFRHFPGTLDIAELTISFEWCAHYLECALVGHNPINTWVGWNGFPKFPKYVHWMECRYRATCHDGTLSKAEIVENIKLIEEGRFDVQSPCRLPR